MKSLDLTFARSMPRQYDFLRQLLPLLTEQSWLRALWLGGSFARGDADRWSSVELFLLVPDDLGATETGRRSIAIALQSLLQDVFGATLWLVDSETDRASGGGHLQGYTLAEEINAATHGGVHFRLTWDSVANAQSLRKFHGKVRLLLSAADLPPSVESYLQGDFAAFEIGDVEQIEQNLYAFWTTLMGLPALINRGEELAALHLLSRLRYLLVDLVVALNGVRRPPTLYHVNRFLGPAQRESFEKIAVVPELGAPTWIGQGVSLIVLYRWYAPQLLTMYQLNHLCAPLERLERSALALLSAEIAGWPARIRSH